MPDLKDGESAQVQGSARVPYILKNIGGVYSCTCPAWRNQSLPIERRSCKHLRTYRGEQSERERLGALPRQTPLHHGDEKRGRRAPVALGPPMGQCHGSDRLVDEREARRRAGLVGRSPFSFAARQRLSRSRLVRCWAAGRVAGRRTVAGSQDVPANREHRPPARPERTLAADQVRGFRCSRRRWAFRGTAASLCELFRDSPPTPRHGAPPGALHGHRSPASGTGPHRIAWAARG